MPKTFGKIFCGLMRKKLNWKICVLTPDRKTNTALYKKTITTVKHGGHNYWNYYICSLPENPKEECTAISLCPEAWIVQQDKDLKHTTKSTGEWLKKQKN